MGKNKPVLVGHHPQPNKPTTAPPKGTIRPPHGPPKGTIRPPGGAPAPAPTPASAPPPFDAGLAASQAANDARRTTLLGDADVDLQQTSQEYGFRYDPATGQFGGFDPTNPFSQAALLAKARNESTQTSELGYQRQSASDRQGLAQSGQLYSGASQNAQQEDDRVIGKTRVDIQSNYDKGYDTLRRGFEDYVKKYLRRKRDIQTVNPDELASLGQCHATSTF